MVIHDLDDDWGTTIRWFTVVNAGKIMGIIGISWNKLVKTPRTVEPWPTTAVHSVYVTWTNHWPRTHHWWYPVSELNSLINVHVYSTHLQNIYIHLLHTCVCTHMMYRHMYTYIYNTHLYTYIYIYIHDIYNIHMYIYTHLITSNHI